MWRKLYRLPILLTAIAALLLGVHLWWARPTLDEVLPASIHEFTVELLFEGFGGEVRLGTYLPVSDERQTILSESFEQGPLAFSDEVGAAGRQAEWNGMPPEGQHRTVYTARVSTRAVQYELPAGLGFGTPLNDAARRQLEETEAIPFRHREIRSLWNRIKPAQSADEVQVLRAIFDYTHDQIEPAPFKGYTDALTALRLGQASCNGKSRLFVALARLNGIPARLVGGVILESGSKRTSHQWVEALLGGHWVPFDPLNGHFATLPADYLKLYRGDEFLFTHTRDINFDHAFRVRRLLAPADSLKAEEGAGPAWLGGMGRFIAANEQISSVFLLFPLVALIVTFCRNVVGLRTFGVFLPMLVAAGCVYTGLLPGMLGFVVILAIGAVAHRFFRGMRVLVIPRIAAVITVLTAMILVGGVLVTESAGHRLALLALFPVVILSFAAERLQEMMERSRLRELVRTIAWTMLVTMLCYLAFESVLLRGLFFQFPELLLVVLALQLAVGRWTGIRASEFYRFLRLFRAAGTDDAGVLGLNSRNIHFISRLNAVHWMTVANDKLATKRHLDEGGVPTPRTLLSVETEHELDYRRGALNATQGFALKPASSSGGQGIVLFSGSDADHFHLLNGEAWSYEQLRAHVRDITRGLHSSADDPDRAIFEELIRADAFSRSIAPDGIPDIRVLVVGGKPVAAMLRVPTRQSGGRANLHQGAAGFSVDLASGRLGTGIHEGQVIDRHPDSGELLAGREVPHWQEVVRIACAAQQAVPLGYAGVDVCLDERRGPVVLEINARPGIEIQNALQKGLVPGLQQALAAGV
jgi:alpha-L-glutamate ligase-like protein